MFIKTFVLLLPFTPLYSKKNNNELFNCDTRSVRLGNHVRKQQGSASSRNDTSRDIPHTFHHGIHLLEHRIAQAFSRQGLEGRTHVPWTWYHGWLTVFPYRKHGTHIFYNSQRKYPRQHLSATHSSHRVIIL